MGSPFSCKCEERKKPIADREWVVTQRNWNTGSFVKDGGEFSDYSNVCCLKCGTTGRTKAKYVCTLHDMDFETAYEKVRENNPEQYGR